MEIDVGQDVGKEYLHNLPEAQDSGGQSWRQNDAQEEL